HSSFRAYADWMETEEFRAGLATVTEPPGQSAVMCSESLWWRCHRRLLSDHLVRVEGAEVVHLMHDGSRREYPRTPEAPLVGAVESVTGQPMVVYDGGQPPLSAPSPQ